MQQENQSGRTIGSDDSDIGYYLGRRWRKTEKYFVSPKKIYEIFDMINRGEKPESILEKL